MTPADDERLQRIEDKLDRNTEALAVIRERTAVLEVKAGFWGFIAGAIPAFITYLFRWGR